MFSGINKYIEVRGTGVRRRTRREVRGEDVAKEGKERGKESEGKRKTIKRRKRISKRKGK